MINKDYRYYIHKTRKRKASWYKKYWPRKKHVPWMIALGCISILGAGIGLTLYGRELSAYPTGPLAQIDHLTLATIASHQPPPPLLTVEEPTAAVQKPQIATPKPPTWQNITIKKGDNLSHIFSRLGLSARQVHEVMSLGNPVHSLARLRPGQLLQIKLEGDNGSRRLIALRLNFSPIEYLEVLAEEDKFEAKRISRNIETRIETIAGSIKSSLSEDGLQAGLTNKQVIELTQIFGWDIDFALDLRPGDSFKVLFEEHYFQNKKLQNGPILAAEFTNHGKTFQAIRYADASGHTGYYTPAGLSMRKAFLRTPVNYARISSHFNLRRKHPVLNRIRAHKGVDYAAPIGTPVKAAGDGKVQFVGRKGGYGKAIVLQHGAKYSTLYGHLSRFKSGLKAGSKVKQGATIGYVGQTGLATGPHLHYEFLVNGVHRNPLTVKLPQAAPIPRQLRQDFQKHAAKLEAQLDAADIAIVLNQSGKRQPN
ncbi:Peptidase M23B [Nitrosococcus oceani ATCC 19707]|uniref:Peptidase M23B n=2 Tax=Nitrosococcus oceani TaxID=1229 RepID=Q3JCM4_NITOC|nr:peptidoglycan DD-metalloendopeptidase family protein [Nitrosococcus oceani]ABA57422.1 Peptidase M23B [Nitrosococcus oceani ATCC 19707]EDZ67556.1 M23 peptidase domain protein [Nitrosococcus oceani AFC27]KFI20195.1 peptidase M23 [Nitrosococcus oceani C-27]